MGSSSSSFGSLRVRAGKRGNSELEASSGSSVGGSRPSILAEMLVSNIKMKNVHFAIQSGCPRIVFLLDGTVLGDAVLLEEIVHLLVSSDLHCFDLTLRPRIHLHRAYEAQMHLPITAPFLTYSQTTMLS